MGNPQEAQMYPVPSQPLRIGVLGAAKIARAFIAGVAGSPRVVVTSVASRDLAKAQAFASDTGLLRALGSYEALLADPEIDAIYNPLPNSMHAEWSIRAVEAGKHVLCEKPLAMSAAEARAMFAAAAKHGRHLVEAYPYRSQPQTLKLVELIKAGAIGNVRLIRSSFGVYFDDPTNIRLIPEVGGGSLMDAGSYAVSLALLVAGEAPIRVHAVQQLAATGVDISLVATLEFASGVLAQISSSFATSYHRHALISGDNGSIETAYLNHPPIGGPAVLHVRRGRMVTDPIETITTAEGNGFRFEADAFQQLVAHGPTAWNGATPAESINIAATLEALGQSARSGHSVTLAA
jgi:D-xylose 1-dehydrogenase (NADP+, D-xylono-1,5-lactone-forming)